MNLKHAIHSLAVLLIVSVSAHAATTTLRWQVSVNGGAFVSETSVAPGDVVTFRLRVTGTGLTGIGGLARLNFVPTLTSCHSSDVVLPLSSEQFPEGSAANPFPGTLTHPNLGVIENVYTGGFIRGPGSVGGTGRNAPFGAQGTAGSGVPQASFTPGDATLRWTSALMGHASVLVSQSAQNDSGVAAISGIDDAGTPATDDDEIAYTNLSYFSTARTNAIVFSYSIVMGDAAPRSLVAGSNVLDPIEWYSAASGSTQSVLGSDIIVQPAVAHVLFPAPGGVALFGFASLLTTRRRRP